MTIGLEGCDGGKSHYRGCKHTSLHPSWYSFNRIIMRTTLSLNQIVEQWIAETDALEATRKDYRRKISLWFRWLKSRGSDPRMPSRADVIDYKNQLLSSGKSRFTVNGYVTVVKIFYAWCEGKRYYDNIALGIKSSNKQKEYYKLPLSRKQASDLVESIDTSTIIGKRDKLMIMLMLSNGLRSCEVQRIDIKDFDMMDGEMILHIQRKGSTDKHDTVVISNEVAELFEDYVSSKKEYEIDDALFTSHMRGVKNERINRETISFIIKRRLRAIGIDNPKITAHSLRHTCGSLMIEQGYDPQLIQDMLGHTDPATTRIYTNMARQKRLFESAPSKRLSSILTKKSKKKK